MPKFFMPVAELQPAFLTLTGENAAHAKVLRLKPGDTVTVCDGNGTDHTCTISDLSQGQVSLVVRHSAPTASEAKCAVRIFLAFAKADKLEHVVQKATELGAAEIIAFPSKRCVSTPDAGALTKKLRSPLPPRPNPAGAAFPPSQLRPVLTQLWRRLPRQSCRCCFTKTNSAAPSGKPSGTLPLPPLH